MPLLCQAIQERMAWTKRPLPRRCIHSVLFFLAWNFTMIMMKGCWILQLGIEQYKPSWLIGLEGVAARNHNNTSITKEEQNDMVLRRSHPKGWEGLIVESRNSPSSYSETFESSKPRRPLAIFYNVYVRPSPNNNETVGFSLEQQKRDDVSLDLASTVIQEQINQLAHSPVASSEFQTTLYYVTVGRPVGDLVHRICSRHNSSWNCQHIQHHDNGYEELTLSRLYDYCQTRPEETVMYFHSKGTFHNTTENIAWRKAMLMAITHPSCLDPPGYKDNLDDQSTCNVCGLLFFPAWTLMMPGNFWTAKCWYVNKLLHPVEFIVKKKKLEQQFRSWKREGLLDTDLWSLGASQRGESRFAAGKNS